MWSGVGATATPVLRLGGASPGGLVLPDASPTPCTMYAPRGVWTDGKRIVVCDTGNHRVLIWHSWPEVDGAAADVVLGQPNFHSEGPNAGGTDAACGMNLPTGVTVIDGRLVVADAWNHRVLAWDDLPEVDYIAPTYVLGQEGFTAVEANRGGPPSLQSFYWPFGVGSVGGVFWVTDTGNRRVLGWISRGLPDPASPADILLGQDDAAGRADNRGGSIDGASFRWPHAVAGDAGTLYIADAGDHRVLGWSPPPKDFLDAASLVLGQQDFAVIDEFKNRPQGAARMRFPYSVVSDPRRLVVADTSNNRILIWHGWPRSGTAVPADTVLAQPDMDANGENRWTAVEDDTLCWPYGLSLAGDLLAVADSGNNRAMVWRLGQVVLRQAFRVTGVVQGVGYRPFVARHAAALGLTGLVGNDAGGVFVEAQGDGSALAALADALAQGPPMALVDDVDIHEVPPCAETGFRIVPSPDSAGATSIPADTAVCADCLAEMRDPTDRRFGYAFIACTNCGPRYTIATGLPYDRPNTTMADFPLCRECQAEYDDPSSRRFHAQPTACPQCGPRLSASVDVVTAWLLAGRLVALKGVGGYHVACDARDKDAVARLRARKQRGAKPFALMAADEATAGELVRLDATALAALASPARPIVLAPSRDAGLQSSVAPGNGYLGVMLPYAPLHHLLFDGGAPRVLVMTSGNLADEPICTTKEEATERLADLADAMVHHDRRIQIACDDSVVRAGSDAVQPVRRSRGYAPLPVTLAFAAPELIAVGGELKTTVAVTSGRRAWLSQHIGDTESLETLDMLARTVQALTRLQRIQAEAVVSDAHPGYLSRRWAADEAGRRGVPHLTVQHHHAHLASLLAEHQWAPGRPVLGFAFDGTGYGTDGTIWGGELLLGSYADAERIGHLREISLPGGDAAIRRPLRTALAHLTAAGAGLDPAIPSVRDAAADEVGVISRMLATGAGCTPTTSMGRLFDAVASLLEVRHDIDYEGQAAIELEALAAGAQGTADGQHWAPSVRSEAGMIILDPATTIAAVLDAALRGADRSEAAYQFHDGVAVAVTAAAVEARRAAHVDTVGLTGGVFANAVLTARCQGRLIREGFTVLVHHRVPPNDGGLALGQVAVAALGGADVTRGV